MHLATKYST